MEALVDRSPDEIPSAPPSLSGVLAEIAEIASQTLDLQEVFHRVANSVRRIVPFEHMGVVRILDGERAVVHATTICPERTADGRCVTERWQPVPLDSWSPQIRPRQGSMEPIADARLELDPAFPIDAKMLAGGVRSTIWEPFGAGGQFVGGLWLASTEPRAFSPEHRVSLRPIAALVGSAVEHSRIWHAERRRQQRLEKIDELLGSLAESFDSSEVIGRLSAGLQEILPHDLMCVTELDLGAGTLRVKAFAGECDIAVPTDPVALSRDERDLRVDFEIVHDIPAELTPATERERILLATGLRSWLRVPLWMGGEVKGSFSFFQRQPDAYDDEDAEVARRLAERISLAFSMRRIAEAAQVAAEARERAARLEATVETLSRELAARGRGKVVGASASWKEVLRGVGRVAPSETTVLITGESGTGKEIVADLIRRGSPRARKPFVAVNCAALPEQLLESELFGHEKGAFTGAVTAKIGRLEQAAGGTLFLDEIGEMSPLVQAKLLRVLQEREFQRVGGTRVIRADVRVLAATNRDLSDAIARGEFREDLYYRLNVFEIAIPPLRDRREDILPLAEAFLEELGPTMGRPAAGISRDARDWLLAYSWPGNVRELRNAIERAILFCDGGLITREHLPPPVARPASNGNGSGTAAPGPSGPLPAGGVDLQQVERDLVERALREARGNKSKAARLLGISRAQLYSRIDKHGLAG
jgi:Nif-specific regulatory protein